MTGSIAIIQMKDAKTLLKTIKQIDKTDNGAYFRFRAPVTSKYSVSIIRNNYSYGGSEGLFEIALIDPKSEDVVYNDDFFDGDVGGYLNYRELADAINSVRFLR